MSKPKRSKHPRSGFTLIEAMVALGIAAFGAAATARMLTSMYKSSANTLANSEAVELATRVIAEVNDANFWPGGEDAGLWQSGQAASVTLGEISAPITGSRIQSIGQFDTGDSIPCSGTHACTNPTLLVTYEVRPCPTCLNPFGGTTNGLSGVDVEVSVYNVAPNTRLTRPLHFVVRREYSTTRAASPRS